MSEKTELQRHTDAIIQVGARMNERGWVPATSGNISARLGYSVAITVSGKHKGYLTENDVMVVGPDGAPRGPGQPSAETLLHCHLYRRLGLVHAVVHGHSIAATVITLATQGDLIFQGFEIQKAFGGGTHEARLTVPVFDNDQDIARLAVLVDSKLSPDAPGYVLRGHGVYTWGRTMDEAFYRLEALEFLFQCRLEQMKMRVS